MLLRTPLDIGCAIRDRRRQLGLDQETLAARVGASRKWIIDVEKGKPRAEVGLLLRTIDALDLRLSLDERTGTAGDAAVPDIDRVLDAVRDRRR